MPRFSTSELRDVRKVVFGDVKIKKEPKDATSRITRLQNIQAIEVKEEPRDSVSPFLQSWLSASNHQSRKRSRDAADSIQQGVLPSSPRSKSHTPNPKTKKRKKQGQVAICSACLDEVSIRHLTTLQCTCQDRYCRDCLEAWFSTALKTKQFPRCCDQELIDNDVYDLLSAKTKRRWTDVLEERDQKEIENVIPLYCKTCRQYIRTSQVKYGFGTCPACKMKTCTECRDLISEHRGIYNLCPTYLNDPAFSNLGPNFRRCPKCYVMIEKASGCNELR